MSPGSSDSRAEQSARAYYERALRELDQDAPPPAVAALMLQNARTLLDQGRVSEALDCINATFLLPDYGDMDAVLAEAHEVRGRLRCEAGHLDEALQDFQALQDRARGAGDTWLAALASEHLASVALVLGDTTASVTRLEEALGVFRDRGDDADVLRLQLQLAALYVDDKRWNTAEQALADAVARAQRGNDLAAQGRCEVIRAGMAIQRGNVERARVSVERALHIARGEDLAGLEAEAMALSGIVARESGDLDQALRLFAEAERLAQQVDDAMLLGELACERVEVLARRQEHRLTLRALNRAYTHLARLTGQAGRVDQARRVRQLEVLFLEVTRRWAQRYEGADHDTAGHVDRIADLTIEIARRMGVEHAALFGYRIGAFLHDVGKIDVPTTILNKRGRLTADEWATVKRHPVAGAELLMGTDFPWEVRPIVESHHECWDGSGYPHGRAGEEIPLAARIVCVADVFDALTTRRPFKEALPREEALDVMRREVGRQFDPAVFRVFEDVLRAGAGTVAATASSQPQIGLPASAPLIDDPLTGVADFPSWTNRAANALGERREAQSPVGILVVDIDEFARVNTTYGRLQGDDVLWAVAKVLQRGVRTQDLVGRRSSDEFVILLPDAPAAVASEIAERIRESVGRLRCALRNAPDETLVVTASVAVAVSPDDGQTVETLLAAADRAIFRAKQDGRDRVVVADRAEPARARTGLDFSAFVGREEELRTIVAQLDLAGRGDPRFVSVVGEAGIGKTTLLRQLEPEVRLRDAWLASGRGLPEGGNTAFAPWVSVIRRLVELGAGTADRAWRALPLLVPDLPGIDLIEGDAPASALQQEIVAFIRRAARKHPIVVALEDMHLAAPASWATLDALLTGLDDERLLVLCTTRPELPAPSMEWRRRLHSNTRATLITLQRFSLDEVRRWVRAVFHDAAPGDDVARWVHEFSEGVPHFAAHLLRAGCEDGSIWYGGTRWEWRPPDGNGVAGGMGWVLERRIDRVTPTARNILAAAAVMREALSLELLVSVTGVPEAQVLSALEEGVSASILTLSGDPVEGRYAFKHPLLAEACVRSLPERQRQQIHDLAARVLELRAPSAVAAIASHYHAAGNDAAAFAYATSAAERAFASGAHETALAALQVGQRFATSSRELAALRVRTAEVAAHAGRLAQAEAACDLALEWLDRQTMNSVSIRARRLREWVRAHRGRSVTRAGEGLRVLVEDAAAWIPDELAPTALVAAQCALDRAEWSSAANFARRAIEQANRGRQDAQIADGTLLLGLAESAETPDLGITRLREGLERSASLGDDWRAARACYLLGDALHRSASATEGEDLLVTALERARASHHASVAALVSRSLGSLRARQWNFDEARQWLGDADRLFNTIGDDYERALTHLTSAITWRAAGERERAHTQFDAVARRAREMDVTWMELVATSGAAISNGAPESDGARERWTRIHELLADTRTDWWFPGREYLDAFAIQMLLHLGHRAEGLEQVQRAAARLQLMDAQAMTWLMREVAPAFERTGQRLPSTV